MNSTILGFPDILAMLLLMAALAWLRKRHRQDHVDTWLLGLGFVLLETLVQAVFADHGRLAPLRQAVTLDAYLIAGVTFGWASRRDLVPGSRRFPLFALPALPMFALATMCGLGVTKTEPYLMTIALSVLLGDLYILMTLWRRPRFSSLLLGIHLLIWLPMLFLARQGEPRAAVYWGLAAIYLLVALAFRGFVRRDRIGALVVVASFAIWALCFLVYPAVHGFPVYDAFLEETWKMQKFLVILGMLLMLLEDEMERRREEAMHDTLTGLPNRRLLNDRLAQAIERSRRSGRQAGLFMIDLNGFKAINDRHGHRMGDDVLRLAAASLKSTVRNSDTLARCGGDEFCVVVNDLGGDDAGEAVADALRAAVEQVELPQRCELPLSASVGFALYPYDADDPETLAELADVRMYREKRAGTRVLARA